MSIPTPYEVPLRLRQHLELYQERSEEATLQAIFNALRCAQYYYYINARQQPYTLDLSRWGEPLRAEIEHVFGAMLLLHELSPDLLFEEVYTLLEAVVAKYVSVSRVRKFGLCTDKTEREFNFVD